MFRKNLEAWKLLFFYGRTGKNLEKKHKRLKFSKILFAFIPQINFYMNYYSTMCLGNFDKLSGDLVLLKASNSDSVPYTPLFLILIIFFSVSLLSASSSLYVQINNHIFFVL